MASLAAVIRAVLVHGTDRWQSIGLSLQMSHSEIDQVVHGRDTPAQKLRALIERKRSQVGDAALKALLLEACERASILPAVRRTIGM